MKNILFLCTGNSCRSQMAEALARKHLQGKVNVFSAGIKAHGLNPYAIAVLKDKNVNVAQLKSKVIDDLPKVTFDLVVTLCGDAAETCPVFIGARTVHHGFDDPPRLTKGMTDEAQIKNCYATVCDEIESFITEMPKIYPTYF